MIGARTNLFLIVEGGGWTYANFATILTTSVDSVSGRRSGRNRKGGLEMGDWRVIAVLAFVTAAMLFPFLRKRREEWRGEFERFCDALQLLPLERKFLLKRVRQGLKGQGSDGIPLRDRYFEKGLGYFTSGDLNNLAVDLLTPYIRCLEAQRRGELLPGNPLEDDEEGLPIYEWDLETARRGFEKAIEERENAPWYRMILAQSRHDDDRVRSDIA